MKATAAVRSIMAAALAALCVHGLAGTPEDQFNAGKALAGKMMGATSGGITDGSSAAGLKSSMPGYTETPPEMGLYGNTNAMNSQAADALTGCSGPGPKSPKCAALKQSQVSVPTGYIKLNSPVLKGKAAADNPIAFVGDIQKQYAACTVSDAKITAPAEYTEKSCSVNYNYWANNAVCTRTRTVVPKGALDCDPGQVISYQVIYRNGSDLMHVQAFCPVGRTDGKMTFRTYAHGSDGACIGWQYFDVDMTVPSGKTYVAGLAPDWVNGCHTLNVYQFGTGCPAGPGFCTKTIRFEWPGREAYETTMTFAKPKELEPSNVIDGCSTYENNIIPAAQRPDGQPTLTADQMLQVGAMTENKSYCFRTASTCVEGPSTKVIKGISVYQSCWKWSNTYSCGDRLPTSTCDPSALIGCTPSADSTCDVKNAQGNCLSLTQKYTCETKAATVSPAVTCADSTTFCDGGSCYDQSYAPNTGLGKSVAILEATRQASKDFSANGGNPTVFVGSNLRCNKKLVGVVDCCDLDSMLDPLNPLPADIASFSCSSEEKDLAVRKVEGKCHEMGEYCSSKTALGCLRHSINHCCFGSKLVRIIHEQGRPQVGRNWGSDESPDCSGLTIDELQHMDFAAMDFSDFIKDIKVTMPDLSAAQGGATAKSKNCYYGAGKC